VSASGRHSVELQRHLAVILKFGLKRRLSSEQAISFGFVSLIEDEFHSFRQSRQFAPGPLVSCDLAPARRDANVDCSPVKVEAGSVEPEALPGQAQLHSVPASQTPVQ
jgi:hypothetical protein